MAGLILACNSLILQLTGVEAAFLQEWSNDSFLNSCRKQPVVRDLLNSFPELLIMYKLQLNDSSTWLVVHICSAEDSNSSTQQAADN